MTGRRAGAPVTRRRALSIVGAGAGAAMVPASLYAGGRPRRYAWTGTALGGPARIALYHEDRGEAERAVAACAAEIERLEQEFSLYRRDSALSRLNRDGALPAPSHDMVRLLEAARRFGAMSSGAFDVTVQPLWRLYAEHFAARPGDTHGPPAGALAAALALVDYRRIAVAPGRIGLAPGMAITLNGIAQGFITDRVADLLRRRGWRHVLIDLGEIRALDRRADGRPWRVAVRDGQGAGRELRIANRAVATSAGSGTRFDRSGRHHHLLDPSSGASGERFRSVTAVAARATTADALSTALYLMPARDGRRLLGRFADAEAWVTWHDGRVERWSG